MPPRPFGAAAVPLAFVPIKHPPIRLLELSIFMPYPLKRLMIKLLTIENPLKEGPLMLAKESPFAFGPALAPLISISGIPFRVGPLILISERISGGRGLVTFMVWTPDPGIEKSILCGEVLLLTVALAALIASRRVQSAELQTPSS